MPTHRRVLVVEDDPELRDTVMDLLLDVGHSVICAVDGADGLERLREYRPDVVLLDLMMPRMDGWEFRRAQQSDPRVAHIPVIVLSAALPEHVSLAGANAFLPKPFTIERLLALVDAVAA